MLLGMVFLSSRIMYSRFSSWRKHLLEQFNPEPQQSQREQLIQHKLPLKSPAKTATKWHRRCLYLFVVTMVLVSIGTFFYFYQDTIFRRKETLANMCDERARMLQDQFNVGLNHVHALAILVSTFHHGKSPSAMDQVFA